jgi:membrane fusion protein, heavy metal efflux system
MVIRFFFPPRVLKTHFGPVLAGSAAVAALLLLVEISDPAATQSLATHENFATDFSSTNASWARFEIAIPMDEHGMQAAGISTIHVVPDQGRTDLTFPGTVAIEQHQLRLVSAPADGLIEAMLVGPDETVVTGQPVAHVRSPDMVEAQQQYLSVVSDEAAARDKLVRVKMQFDGKALPEKELRVAETEAAISKSRLDERMQFLLLMGMDKDDFETLRTTRQIVGTFVVKSPINGTVLTRHASAGEQIKQAAPLFTFGALDPLWVNIRIPSHRLGAISPGAQVTLPAYGVEGHIVRIGHSIDQSAQSVIAVAEISAPSRKMRPGLAVTAYVRMDQPSTATGKNWSVPSTSVVRHRDQSWVFTRSADGFRARPVQIIAESDRDIAVRADFQPSDEVASRGVLALLSELVDADRED